MHIPIIHLIPRTCPCQEHYQKKSNQPSGLTYHSQVSLFFFITVSLLTIIFLTLLRRAGTIFYRSTTCFLLSIATRTPILVTRTVAIRVIVLFLSLRSEEHTSELQSRQYLVCRLLL